MNVTLFKGKYVDAAGRLATVTEYGRDFVNCQHDFQDTGRRGETPSGNGKMAPAAAFQCSHCGVYTVVELNKRER